MAGATRQEPRRQEPCGRSHTAGATLAGAMRQGPRRQPSLVPREDENIHRQRPGCEVSAAQARGMSFPGEVLASQLGP